MRRGGRLRSLGAVLLNDRRARAGRTARRAEALHPARRIAIRAAPGRSSAVRRSTRCTPSRAPNAAIASAFGASGSLTGITASRSPRQPESRKNDARLRAVASSSLPSAAPSSPEAPGRFAPPPAMRTSTATSGQLPLRSAARTAPRALLFIHRDICGILVPACLRLEPRRRVVGNQQATVTMLHAVTPLQPRLVRSQRINARRLSTA